MCTFTISCISIAESSALSDDNLAREVGQVLRLPAIATGGNNQVLACVRSRAATGHIVPNAG